MASEIKQMYKVTGQFTNGHPFNTIIAIADRDSFLERITDVTSDDAKLEVNSISFLPFDVEVIDG